MLSFPFAHPAVIVLCVAPLLLLAWVWRRPTRGLALPVDHGPFGPARFLTLVLRLARSLPALILLLVILILAGPQKIGKPQARRVLTNIEFCVDVSGSMTAKFGEGTRYDASMAAINDFIDYREGDAFGLTFFGVEVLHWVPLTTDVSAFRCAPPFMNPTNPGHPPWLGGTMIGKALLACRKVLAAREQGDRMIILISDGFSADLFGNAVDDVAQKLIDEKIVVYAVHVAGGNVPDSIVNIVAKTGGEHFSSGDQEGLQSVFRRIDQMQETKLEKVTAETTDNYPPFAIASLSLVGASLLCLFGIRYTPW